VQCSFTSVINEEIAAFDASQGSRHEKLPIAALRASAAKVPAHHACGEPALRYRTQRRLDAHGADILRGASSKAGSGDNRK